LLDIEPGLFPSIVSLLVERVEHEDILRLLDPFLRANEFLRTRDLRVLERLFPEVRELVVDIVGRVEPNLNAELKRLI
ncbi:MAG: hypothetical protein GY953_10720, partial [bacterium]|nr:hypothetical protein [bacterium]